MHASMAAQMYVHMAAHLLGAVTEPPSEQAKWGCPTGASAALAESVPSPFSLRDTQVQGQGRQRGLLASATISKKRKIYIDVCMYIMERAICTHTYVQQ